MLSGLSEKVLPQPASFNKKKQYEIHEVLGTGTFGKVMVRAFAPIYSLACANASPHP